MIYIYYDTKQITHLLSSLGIFFLADATSTVNKMKKMAMNILT